MALLVVNVELRVREVLEIESRTTSNRSTKSPRMFSILVSAVPSQFTDLWGLVDDSRWGPCSQFFEYHPLALLPVVDLLGPAASIDP